LPGCTAGSGEAVVAKHLKTKGFIKKQLARLYHLLKKYNP